MNELPWLVVAWLFLVGLYGIATTKNMIHLVGSLLVTQSSTYVLLVAVGFKRGATAPVLKELPSATPTVDPVVQAMTLTDIVVGATVSALLLVFAVQIHKTRQSTDPKDTEEVKG